MDNQSQSGQPQPQAGPLGAPQQSGVPQQSDVYVAQPVGEQPGAQNQQNQQSQPGAQAQAQQVPVQPQHTAQSQYAQAYAQHQVPSAQPAQQPKKSSGGKTFLFGFLGALVACVLALGVATATNMFGLGRTVLGSVGGTTIEAAEEGASLAEAVAAKCLPSVVSVDVYSTQQQQGTSIYDFLFGYGYNSQQSNEPEQVSMGSGVVISEDGYIITNYHVVESGDSFKVNAEGDTYDAELVGSDSSSDVAVLKVKGDVKMTPIEIGDSDDISIGEWVMAIGSPFGLEQSVSTGIISATSRSQIMEGTSDPYSGTVTESMYYPNMIQTDAAINPGNSGGALVDDNGKLIGINTLITSYSGNYAGVGFAIPSNYAVKLAQDIIDGKEPSHAALGVNLTTLTPNVAERYGFAESEGAYVSSVIEGSPADAAGLQIGDIIIGFDGEKVTSASDLTLDVRTKQPGDEVELTINRDGEEKAISVTLGSSEVTQKADSQSDSGQEQQGGQGGNGGYGQGGYGGR